VRPINPVLIPSPYDVSQCAAIAAADTVTKLTSSGIEDFSQGPIGHPGCAGYVVDFQLDKGSVNPTSPEIQFDGIDSVRETITGNYTYYVMNISKDDCAKYKHFVYAYRRRAGEKAFSEFGGGGFVTSWDTGGLDGKGLGGPICRVKPDASFKPIAKVQPPTALGAVDTYRIVLVVAKAPGQLRIQALHVKT
jgi:hypothetical protein